MSQPQTCKLAFASAPPPSPPSSAQYYRDICVAELMDMIDIQYGEYKKSFRQVVNDSDLAADIIVLGLGTAGALAPGNTTKSILAGTAAAVTGAKAAVSADVLYNASIIVIINQMDTDRQNERCIIQMQLNNPVSPTNPPPGPTTLTTTTTTTVTSANTSTPTLKQTTTTPNVAVTPMKTYSMQEASNDLIQYYEVGTFTHALQALQAKSGSQAVAAKQQATNQKTGTTATAGTTSTTGTPATPGGTGAAAGSTPSGSSTGGCSSS
jgi:hypothetical protein